MTIHDLYSHWETGLQNAHQAVSDYTDPNDKAHHRGRRKAFTLGLMLLGKHGTKLDAVEAGLQASETEAIAAEPSTKADDYETSAFAKTLNDLRAEVSAHH